MVPALAPGTTCEALAALASVTRAARRAGGRRGGKLGAAVAGAHSA
jgi:hypothetical protein